MKVTSSVAVDDADDDDNCHTREGTDAKHQPSVRELPRDHVTEEDRSWVNLLVGGIRLRVRHLAAAGCRCGAPCRRAGAIHRQVGSASNGLDTSVV